MQQLLKHPFAILLVVSGLFFSATSQATLYFEPYVGFGTGSTTLDDNSSDALVGPSGGAKLGWFFDYLYLTLDTQISVFNRKGSSSDSSWPLRSTGIGLGVDWNLPIRLFYILDTSSSVTINEEKYNVTGSRIELGYYLDRDILLSIQMISSTVSPGSDDSAAISSSFSGTLLTLNFPLEFTYPETPWREKAR